MQAAPKARFLLVIGRDVFVSTDDEACDKQHPAAETCLVWLKEDQVREAMQCESDCAHIHPVLLGQEDQDGIMRFAIAAPHITHSRLDDYGQQQGKRMARYSKIVIFQLYVQSASPHCLSRAILFTHHLKLRHLQVY